MDKKIIEITGRYAKEVRKFLPVKMIILFGSWAKGRAAQSSDHENNKSGFLERILKEGKIIYKSEN